MALRKTGPKVAGTRSSFFEIAPLKNTRGREEASLSRPRRARQPGWITGAEIDEALREFAKSLTERPILDQICENGRAARSAREEWFKAFAENLERATAGSTRRPSSRVTTPVSTAPASNARGISPGPSLRGFGSNMRLAFEPAEDFRRASLLPPRAALCHRPSRQRSRGRASRMAGGQRNRRLARARQRRSASRRSIAGATTRRNWSATGRDRRCQLEPFFSFCP